MAGDGYHLLTIRKGALPSVYPILYVFFNHFHQETDLDTLIDAIRENGSHSLQAVEDIQHVYRESLQVYVFF